VFGLSGYDAEVRACDKYTSFPIVRADFVCVSWLPFSVFSDAETPLDLGSRRGAVQVR
jgi:hypothetical protein